MEPRTDSARKQTALSKALANEKGTERPTVYAGYYIYADQKQKLIELTAYNKIHGIDPSNASDMIREALDQYLRDL